MSYEESRKVFGNPKYISGELHKSGVTLPDAKCSRHFAQTQTLPVEGPRTEATALTRAPCACEPPEEWGEQGEPFLPFLKRHLILWLGFVFLLFFFFNIKRM